MPANITDTKQLSTFSRGPPDNVTFNFPDPVASGSPDSPTFVPQETKIVWNSNSSLTTGRHWHNTHTEYVQVTAGAVVLTLHDTSRVVTAADGVVAIPRKARHEYMRWDCPGRQGHQLAAQNAFRKTIMVDEAQRLEAGDVHITEWTDPMDGEKEIFFRNLFSAMQEPYFRTQYGGFLSEGVKVLQLFSVMFELDNFLVFLDLGGQEGAGWNKWARAKIEEVVTYLVMFSALLIAKLFFGLSGYNPQWTPSWLQQKWAKRSEYRPKVE